MRAQLIRNEANDCPTLIGVSAGPGRVRISICQPDGDVVDKSRMHVTMTPEEAREHASNLWAAADAAERGT